MEALKAFKDPKTFDLLIEQLQDREPHKRANAAISLADFGDARAVKPIQALLGDRAVAFEGDRPGEPPTTVEEAARNALKKLGVAVEPPPSKPRWKFW